VSILSSFFRLTYFSRPLTTEGLAASAGVLASSGANAAASPKERDRVSLREGPPPPLALAATNNRFCRARDDTMSHGFSSKDMYYVIVELACLPRRLSGLGVVGCLLHVKACKRRMVIPIGRSPAIFGQVVRRIEISCMFFAQL